MNYQYKIKSRKNNSRKKTRIVDKDRKKKGTLTIISLKVCNILFQ